MTVYSYCSTMYGCQLFIVLLACCMPACHRHCMLAVLYACYLAVCMITVLRVLDPDVCSVPELVVALCSTVSFTLMLSC